MTATLRAPIIALSLAAGHAPAQPTITDLGLPPDGLNAQAYAVSADGSVVVGLAQVSPGSSARAFRWTAASGLQLLPLPAQAIESSAAAVNADGSIAVGRAFVAPVWRAVRWTGRGAVQDLGPLPGQGANLEAQGVSADGLVIVGRAAASGFGQAFRWTDAAGYQLLPLPPGAIRAEASATGAGGSVVVGHATLVSGAARPFRWTDAAGTQPLPMPAGAEPSNSAFAEAVSADGAVAVGYGTIGVQRRALRWVGGDVQSLGVVGDGLGSEARALAAGGRLVVGMSLTALSQPRAAVWTAAGGMVDLNAVLPAMGASLDGWTLEHAHGASADGSTIVGWGQRGGQVRAFVVRGFPGAALACPANCDSSTTAPALNAVDFQCFLQRYQAAQGLPVAQQVADYANCNGSTTVPVLNALDFACFLARYRSGCP